MTETHNIHTIQHCTLICIDLIFVRSFNVVYYVDESIPLVHCIITLLFYRFITFDMHITDQHRRKAKSHLEQGVYLYFGANK